MQGTGRLACRSGALLFQPFSPTMCQALMFDGSVLGDPVSAAAMRLELSGFAVTCKVVSPVAVAWASRETKNVDDPMPVSEAPESPVSVTAAASDAVGLTVTVMAPVVAGFSARRSA